MAEMQKATYYEILEVKPDSPQHEITKAYERAKATYATDNPALYSVFTQVEAKQLLQVVEEAYTILGNAIYRARYNERLKDPTTKPEDLEFKAIAGQFVPPTGDRNKLLFKPEYKVNDVIEEQIKTEIYCDGSFLKKIREYKNVSLEKMSEVTKISFAYIEALEENDYSNLPAQVFIRGFVGHVSRVLGLDEKKVADSYMSILRNNIGKK